MQTNIKLPEGFRLLTECETIELGDFFQPKGTDRWLPVPEFQVGQYYRKDEFYPHARWSGMETGNDK